ncbi:MAG: DUF4349 domain-containing protein [Candidatus Sulfotelmatobacter sp.]
MSTLAESLGVIRKPWQWAAFGGAVLLVWGVVAFPQYRTRIADQGRRPTASVIDIGTSSAIDLRRESVSAKLAEPASPADADAEAGRKMIRTASMSMVVQHPAEVADKITALAESLGGYVEAAESSGDSATAGTLTIRIPAARFDQAKSEIRKLGVRIESENIGAQDVTRQYVDQDASLRNLKAEEAQYLAIMKQASTVKDMLAVSEQLSNVRGQIEQQQAEFNALSHQIETVSIAISLRTEAEAQVLGLNWRPGYQLRMALRDGLEAIANYATAMIGILFYLPAALLWAGTTLGVVIVGMKSIRWIGRRRFGSKVAEVATAKS